MPMVEFLIFQNANGEILRIIALNAKFLGCAVIYDTTAHTSHVKWYCNTVAIESRVPYWTMRKLILSFHDNIVERSYEDAMNQFSMAKFRVPHFDELIILDYTSPMGTLIRKDLIHVQGGLESIRFKRECLYDVGIVPHLTHLSKIKSIVPDTPDENVNIRDLI